MTLSIGPATDYLVATARTAVDGLTVNGETVDVVDGYPAELTNAMFVIGCNEPPPNEQAETVETRAWAALGQEHLEEDYAVPCYIDVRVGGTDQKKARDGAESVFNAFWPLLKADMTLGGVLHSRYAELVELTERPSNVGTAAEPGRRHLIVFGVHCRNITS